MRLSFLILLPALSLAAAAVAAVPKKSPLRCPDDRPAFTGEGGSAEAKRLGDLPPAQLYLGVDRKVDGCRSPVILRFGIGAGFPRAAPPRPQRP